MYNTSPDQQRIRAEKDAALAAKVPALIGKDGKLTAAAPRQASEIEATGQAASTNQAQMTASEILVAQSDVLLAVWDGLPARGSRGTVARVAASARARLRDAGAVAMDDPVERVRGGEPVGEST